MGTSMVSCRFSLKQIHRNNPILILTGTFQVSAPLSILWLDGLALRRSNYILQDGAMTFDSVDWFKGTS